MNNDSDSTQCINDSEQFVINSPGRLVKRVHKYAEVHENTATSVVIEALDALLGGRGHG